MKSKACGGQNWGTETRPVVPFSRNLDAANVIAERSRGGWGTNSVAEFYGTTMHVTIGRALR